MTQLEKVFEDARTLGAMARDGGLWLGDNPFEPGTLKFAMWNAGWRLENTRIARGEHAS